MSAPMKETQLVKACLDILAAWHIPAWRVNSGGMRSEYKGKERFMRFNSAPGHADIAGVLHGGRALFIECKVGKNEPTAQQRAFLDRVTLAGARALVIYTPDELIRELNLEAS